MAEALAESALAAIEFPAALDQVSQYAVTPLGAARIRALTPRTDVTWIALELGRVFDVARLLEDGADLEPVPFPDTRAASGRLSIDGAVLAGDELAAVAVMLGAARVVGAKLRRQSRDTASLSALAAPEVPPELEPELLKAIDPDGRVLDAASRDLARIRREIVTVRQDIIATLERLLGTLDARHKAGDAAPTVRSGRYVIPVRHSGRGRLGGIVHDESATHATVFIEPAETMEQGNRLRGLEAEEAREVQRILRELTQLLRPHADVLEAALEMLIAVDACYARARFAQALKAVAPRVVAPGEAPLALKDAAHPLLFAEGRTVVRFDLVLEPHEHTVLISGPNTGGKTVLLKAAGLTVALAQSGVPPAVGEGTVLPVMTALYCDIGDRQSIKESLSTFSAHVAALREVVLRADGASLVLLDELGTGTDPVEGAALAGAVLAALTRRGAWTIATTHLGALKELAAREPGVVNASLEFDAATLAPTYRFTKGMPGRSYGLAIARRLGMPEDVLAEAERTVPEADRRLEAALAAVEARGQDIDRRAAAAEALRLDAENLKARLEKAEQELAERESELAREKRELERSRKAATREVLLEAREDVERAIAEARAGREKEARRALEAEIAALAEQEKTEKAGGQAVGRSDGQADEGTPLATGALKPGARVRIRSLGLEGEVESVQGDDVAVRVRGRRVRVRARDLGALS
jgi:DNA mismatch repair protein MutS2